MSNYQFSTIIGALFCIAACSERISGIKMIFWVVSVGWFICALISTILVNH